MRKLDVRSAIARMVWVLLALLALYLDWYTGADGFDVVAGFALGAVGIRRPGDRKP